MQTYSYTYGSESDHNRFKVINFNREVKDPHVVNIAKSMTDVNLIGANPIIVSDDYIIDGQHRYEACKKLGIPVPYIEIKGMTEADRYKAMQKLNSNAKNWGLADYLKFYVKQNKESYLILENFCKKYSITVSLAIYMLNDFEDNYYKNAANASGFKYGLLEIIDQKKAERVAYGYIVIRDSVIAEHKKYKKQVKSISFIKAVVKLLGNNEDVIDFKKMHMAVLADLSKKNPNFTKKESVEEYYNMLIDIYTKFDSSVNLPYYKDTLEQDSE